MPLPTLDMLFGQGVLATTAHMLLTQAFRYASAAVLAPFTYAQIVNGH